MSKTKKKGLVFSTLKELGLVEPVSEESTKSVTSILCRLNKANEKAWIAFIERLLVEYEFTLHICKKYVIKDGSMVFAWHVSFSTDMDQSLASLMANKEVSPVKATKKPALPPDYPKNLARRNEIVSVVEPPKVKPALKVISNRIVDGKREIVEEMSLPHLSTDLNVPNEKGKGAKGGVR